MKFFLCVLCYLHKFLIRINAPIILTLYILMCIHYLKSKIMHNKYKNRRKK